MGAPLETLSALFLAELEALDAFAGRRELEGGLAPGRDDPDVRRLIEAMAFFSARSRAGAVAATASAVRRIAAGTLDDLLVPAPAALMVHAVPDAGLLEPVLLPQGSLLRAVTPEGKTGIFAMTRPLTILPLVVEGAQLVEIAHKMHAVIRVRALRPLRGALKLSFYVRRLNDYRASLALHDALDQHLARVFVVADGDGPEVACRAIFGGRPPPAVEEEIGEPGALAQIRSFFHLPEQDLFVHVTVPQPRAPWTTLAIHLELDETFPADLGVAPDTFQLSVVPAENAWTDLSVPILCDGTKDAYPIEGPSQLLEGVTVDGVRGVHRSTDRGFAPILPAALAQAGDTYEFDEASDEGGARIRLRIEGAFEKPSKVQVDARWSQPAMWSSSVGRLALSLQTRHLPSVAFRALGAVRRPAESPIARDPARSLDVLALRMRPTLGRRDLAGLLELLGTGGDGPYRGAHALIDELDASEAPDPARRAGGIRHVYRLAIRRPAEEDAPLVRRLAAQVAALLDAWTEDAVDVEITTRPDPARRALPSGTRS